MSPECFPPLGPRVTKSIERRNRNHKWVTTNDDKWCHSCFYRCFFPEPIYSVNGVLALNNVY